jgi:hypothetical protein
MKLFSYESARKFEKQFLSMTTLTIQEFDKLSITFGECWSEYKKINERDIKKGGRPPILATIKDKLFFILFYFKTYPLQEVMAFSFEMSQGEANEMIHELSLVLKMTLQKTDFLPPRLSADILAKLENEDSQYYAIDGTERPIVRPSNSGAQKNFFSGKKGRHTIKNMMITGIDDYQIKGLGATHEGKKHDKKICDEEQIVLPKESICYADTAFIGYEIENVKIIRPKKKPRGGELTLDEKKENRLISSIRIAVEHVISGVKRCRIVKDIFRNTLYEYDDLVMELACGLHNFRTAERRQAY